MPLPEISIDRSDRKRAHDQRRASEQLFRSIFEDAQIGITFYKIDTKEIFPNRAMQEMLGRTEQELSRLEQWDEITPRMIVSPAPQDIPNSSRGSAKGTNGNSA